MAARNILVTGPPRSGKSTLIERVVEGLERPATGFITVEIRERNRRVGFAIATLAGGIAHQFNNALVGITGNIELLEMDLSDNECVDKYIEPMKASISRMSHLTNQLLAYARGGKYQPRILSLSDLVEDSLPLIKEKIDPAIRVETDLSRNISKVDADLKQMQMVISLKRPEVCWGMTSRS